MVHAPLGAVRVERQGVPGSTVSRRVEPPDRGPWLALEALVDMMR